MDIDVSPLVPIRTLRNTVDQILGGPALAAGLRPHGISGLRFSAPKQTETTQRWKILLDMPDGVPLSTRLEFSRRTQDIEANQSTPTRDVLETVFFPPFVAAHYGPQEMMIQKIRALGSPSRVAARDLFDLHHLCFQYPDIASQKTRLLGPKDIEKAVDKVNRFSLDDFRQQVLPFLPEDLHALYGHSAGFRAMQETVERRLTEWL
jgi:hypothetical protein